MKFKVRIEIFDETKPNSEPITFEAETTRTCRVIYECDHISDTRIRQLLPEMVLKQLMGNCVEAVVDNVQWQAKTMKPPPPPPTCRNCQYATMKCVGQGEISLEEAPFSCMRPGFVSKELTSYDHTCEWWQAVPRRGEGKLKL